MTRTTQLLATRPTLPNAQIKENMSWEEQFQNASLRPILKFQHPLLVAVVRQHMQGQKVAFADFSLARKQQYIEQLFTQNHQLKTLLKGIIIGQFSLEEYEAYTPHSNRLNKRLFSMLKKRILDSLDQI